MGCLAAVATTVDVMSLRDYMKKRGPGRPTTKHGKVRRPHFMEGVLYDVWFLPNGRKRYRERITVTTDPSRWRNIGWRTLDIRVRERFDCLDDAGRAKLQVTDRPAGNVVVEIRWQS